MNSRLFAQAESSAVPDETHFGTIVALVVFIVASVVLGTLAGRVIRRSSFVQGYFLGNRALGAWAIALTATVQSGGTFMGFPSLVYTHGWIVGLWIASYMIVPITGFGLVGKRIALISRTTQAVTMPDLFRERFQSPALGLITSLLIICFLSLMMIAQFKAGAIVMKLAMPTKVVQSITIPASNANVKAAGEETTVDQAPNQAAPTGLQAWWQKADKLYLIGLILFSVTVVGYTMIGGFLAAVWTDLFQSVVMFFGVMILLFLALKAAGGLENASRTAMVEVQRVSAESANPQADAGLKYVTGPGYSPDGRQYLPLGLAFSFFIFWPGAGFATPASVTRIMACKDTQTLRKSIVLLCVYNIGIYLPLICICICARALMPDLAKPDEVIPRMAIRLTNDIPFGSLITGMILAAPFGAIMATVSSYLVIIASGLVRDIYQRFIDPKASAKTMRRLAGVGMVIIGVGAILLNLEPVRYLQALVVFSSGGAGASFLVPCLMLCYWQRATAAGVISAMLCGAGTLLGLYFIGFVSPDPMIGANTEMRPYFLFGLEPSIWGIAVSAVAGILVSHLTAPPEAKHVALLFGKPPARTGA
jgi:sodium/pantothenate symporter